MRKLALLAVPAALVVGILAGCSSTGTSSGGTVSDETPTPVATQSKTAEAAAPKFGQTYTFSNGLKLSLSAPETFTPSEYAAGKAANNVKFTVTVVNGTKETLTPALLSFTATAAGQAGQSIEDTEQSVSSFPQANSVAVGATTSWTTGFGFAGATDDLTVEVNPNDFTSKAVTFTK